MIRERLLRRAEKIMTSRPPDFEIGPPGDRYMQRWFITPWSRYERGSKPKNWWDALKRKLPNVYLHSFLHDDEDRALHNHPWPSCSFLLKNNYWEVVFAERALASAKLRGVSPASLPNATTMIFRRAGSVSFRRADAAHRIVLERGPGVPRMPVRVVSLFFTGFVAQHWGFICAKGFVPWQDFVGARDRGSVGRGCGED